ncbi:hypothetical protein PIB30_070471 [Stylosanthes scabra]|uniref:Uncharacterized protein n=1 Tax=Stylosanthes scabra TaxID=79078 RepID=A0ABU6UMV1_9FABA|nr:hypothetical protein [Stylosanthes scabra]
MSLFQLFSPHVNVRTYKWAMWTHGQRKSQSFEVLMRMHEQAVRTHKLDRNSPETLLGTCVDTRRDHAAARCPVFSLLASFHESIAPNVFLSLSYAILNR